MGGMRLPRTGKLGKLMIFAPIALEIVSLVRKNQKAKASKYVKARKRDKAFDFLLGQAERKMGKKGKSRRWF